MRELLERLLPGTAPGRQPLTHVENLPALTEWLAATRSAIASCECAVGCPSCVQSPKCGNGNDPLDKGGAVQLLDLVLSHLSRV